MLTRVRKIAAELDLDPHQTERIFRLLIEMSIAAQQGYIRDLDKAPLRVAYQGVEGSFSHLTAQRQYAGRPGGVVLHGYELFRQAAEGVLGGLHDIALLPIENSTAGSINETYDLLAEGGRANDGNFLWSGQLAAFVLFVATAVAVLRAAATGGTGASGPGKFALCGGVFLWHVTSGIQHLYATWLA